ncbi:hypothetical protein CHU98_g11219, partial [Xylaria longipes]
GDAEGLTIRPQLPPHWDGMKVKRLFRGATFLVDIQKADVDEVVVKYGDVVLPEARFTSIRPGETYQLYVSVPK